MRNSMVVTPEESARSILKNEVKSPKSSAHGDGETEDQFV